MNKALAASAALAFLPLASCAKDAAEGAPARVLKAAPRVARDVEFNRDIRPLFQDTCFQCHGADAKKIKGNLQLDTLEHAGRPDAEGRRAIVPGHPEKSLAWERITSADSDEVMPPPDSHKALTAEQKETIRRWIAQGAKYQTHWSYLPPRARPAPVAADPLWNVNFIDAWVAAGLETSGLKPNPEAGREQLIRRVSLDLTGLPPDPADVESFAKDKDPQAYEKLVDRLLASPRYGEHMARQWLDLARYGDTHGIHFDNYRSIWPYRDWVIRAFNANLPYDRFSIEQLAGDLLPDPTQDQFAATGYLRCNPTTNEGGVIAEEYLAIYAKDRVDTFSATWLGLSMGCAACHDHKFDPVTQTEFYRLAAYFRNIDTPAMDGNVANTPPSLPILGPADLDRAARLAADIRGVKEDLGKRPGQCAADFEAWAAAFKPADVPADPLLQLDAAPDGSLAGTLDGKPVSLPGRGTPPPAGKTRDFAENPFTLGELAGVIGNAGDFEKTDAFSCGCWVKAHGATGSVIARMDVKGGHRGWDLELDQGRLAAHCIHAWNGNAIKVIAPIALPPDTWQHVFVTYDGSGTAAGMALYINGRRVDKVEFNVNNLAGSIRTQVPLTLGSRSNGGGEGASAAQIRGLRLHKRLLSPAEVAAAALEARDIALLSTPAARRDPKETQRLLSVYIASFDPESERLRQRLRQLEEESAAIPRGSPVTLIAREKPGRASARILLRGQYDRKGDEVFPGVPAAIGVPLPDGAPENRLALAQWLFRPEHPLTARVEANRLWQQLFGQGLVPSTEDLGSTGEWPSHPELLDQLAIQLRDSHWDIKAMLRLMVLSRTYRQDARNTPLALDKDPRNRLLSRGPRHRLDAEVIRDSALQSAGLLVEKLGGPSVKPYQPDGIWEGTSLAESSTNHYEQDHGEALYRRSLYTFIKRAAPPPNMETFNATSRETLCARRDRTNTPLQALVSLNDPQFIEAARVLAQRMLAGAGDDSSRLIRAHLLVTSRRPEPARLKAMEKSLAGFRLHFKSHPDEAPKLLAVGESKSAAGPEPGELAAWTMLCSQLQNLDETLNN